MSSTRKTIVIRIYIIIAFVVLAAVIVVARLYTLQIRDGAAWRERAEAQYVYTESGILRRGSIFLSLKDGSVRPAATMRSGYILGIDFRIVENPEATYAALSKAVPRLDKETFMRYANESSPKYRELDKRLTEDEAAAIDEAELIGVVTPRTQWRVYPYEELLARTVGFVGWSEDGGQSGQYGLERAYEPWLQRPDVEHSVNFYAELFGNIKKVIQQEGTEEPADIVTTIEPVVAEQLRDVLTNVQETYGSEITGGIIMHPKTGAIYAMDAVPSFNPNDRSGVSLDRFTNPNTRSLFEFGSIIKPLTMAAGIDAGVVSRHATYEDTGCVVLSTERVCNWDGRARGVTDMQAVLSESLNVGVIHVMQLLGKDRFKTYFNNLHLDDRTGIDAGGEESGSLRNLLSKRDINYATASYGHGISMTPVAAIRALAAIANDGVLPSPRIGKEYRFVSGETKQIHFPPGERVFSEETTDTVTSMLVEVVDKAMTRGNVRQERYSIAAKTGTAFLPGPEGGYDTERFLHSFFGYFPAYDPEFIVLLYTRDPQDVTYASETLTDAFGDLASFLINYYEIPPDR